MNATAEKTSEQTHAVTMTHEHALSIIARASEDRFLAREIDKLRGKCCVFVNEVMHEVTLALAAGSQTAALLRSRQDTAAALCSAARQREGLARQRRELAEAMVIGALLNSDNLDWNPLDPASGRSDSKSILLALLKTLE